MVPYVYVHCTMQSVKHTCNTEYTTCWVVNKFTSTFTLEKSITSYLNTVEGKR